MVSLCSLTTLSWPHTSTGTLFISQSASFTELLISGDIFLLSFHDPVNTQQIFIRTVHIHVASLFGYTLIVWINANLNKCMHQKLSLTVNVKMFPFISFNHIILTISEQSNFSLFFFKMQSSQKLSGPKILQVKRRT